MVVGGLILKFAALAAKVKSESLLWRLVFVLVLPLILLSAWVAYQVNATLDLNTSRLSEALEIKARVNDLLPLLLVQDDATKAMLVDPGVLEIYSGKKIDAYDRHLSLLDTLYKDSSNQVIRSTIDQLRAIDSEKLRPVDTQILEQLFENIEVARKHYFESYEPSRAIYEKTLRSLIDLVTKQADDLTLEVRADNNRLTRNVGMTLSIGIAGIICVIVVLARTLQRSKANTQVLLSSLNEGLFFFDKDGRIAPERTQALGRVIPGSTEMSSLAQICNLVAKIPEGNIKTCLGLLWNQDDSRSHLINTAS